MSEAGGRGRLRLRRVDRLRSSKDFRRVSREGARVASRCFILLVAERPAFLRAPSTPATRLGLTVSRRVGGAVTRNRVKRRIREWFRTHRGEFPVGKDVVVIARPAAAGADLETVGRELRGALARLPAGAAAR